jgi:hypothetical protein
LNRLSDTFFDLLPNKKLQKSPHATQSTVINAHNDAKLPTLSSEPESGIA